MRPVRRATSFPILLHDGKQARPIGQLVVSGEPPIRPAPLPPAAAAALQRPAGAARPQGTPCASIWRSAARDRLGQRRSDFAASAAPAFRAKTGRTVVLALTNRADIATVFHLHGHHFRLLDRLDDGWKPFWLDTLAIEPGQTQRIAFLAEYPGRWLIESVATDWAAPRLVRWYSVD